jgi:2,3-bisphosphoglycerate-independent phosphoglycerate mutase
MSHQELLSRLAVPTDSKVVLLVIDGVGDLRTDSQPKTALDLARTPNLDTLAARSAVGRLVPVIPGVTPGSGPGHLGLFGYDPADPATEIGRGVLEALGLGLDLKESTVAVRGNFATADETGALTDRRAGRPSTDECRRLCALLNEALETTTLPAMVHPGEGHRFVLTLEGEDLSPSVADTDPQQVGVPPLDPRPTSGDGEATAGLAAQVVERLVEALAGEAQANRVLLRGFSRLPRIPLLPDLHQARFGAFAGYPLYRGVAAACGMDVVDCGKWIEEIVESVATAWADFDFFFLHVKQTDQAGEDGNLDAKIEIVERVDAALPGLLGLEPDAIAVTADHSTPAPLAAHSWHPVPVLLRSDRCFVDDVEAFTEQAVVHGHLGTLPSCHLMGLLLANAGKLQKFGA